MNYAHSIYVKCAQVGIVIVYVFLNVVTVLASNTGITGYNIYDFMSASDSNSISNIDGSKVVESLQTDIGLSFGYLNKPASIVNPANRRKIDIIRSSYMAELTGALGLFDFMSLGLNIPISMYQSGINYSNLNTYSTHSIGNIGFNLKGTIVKENLHGFGLGFLSKVSFPTGNSEMFLGEGKFTWLNKVIIDRHIKSAYFSINLGYKIRKKLQLTSITIDDMLQFGLGFQYTLPSKDKTWHIFSELMGASVISNFDSLTTPIIIRTGVKKYIGSNVLISANGDLGITNGIGAHRYGLMARISFFTKSREKWYKNTNIISRHNYITVPFGFDSSQLDLNSKQKLKTIALQMINENCHTIYIEGHTDSMGSQIYNQILSKQRAQAVFDILLQYGISMDKMYVHAHGERKPIYPNTSRERHENRRVEVVGMLISP